MNAFEIVCILGVEWGRDAWPRVRAFNTNRAVNGTRVAVGERDEAKGDGEGRSEAKGKGGSEAEGGANQTKMRVFFMARMV